MSTRVGEHEPFIFWLFGPWETHAHRYEIFRCDIDFDSVRISGPNAVVIPTTAIERVEQGEHGFGRTAVPYVLVSLRGDGSSFKLYPVNPFFPTFKTGYTPGETVALYETIDYCRHRSGPHRHTNPYVRMAEAMYEPHRAEGKRADVSPLEYFPPRRITATEAVIKLLATLVLVAVMTAVFFAVLVLLCGRPT